MKVYGIFYCWTDLVDEEKIEQLMFNHVYFNIEDAEKIFKEKFEKHKCFKIIPIDVIK